MNFSEMDPKEQEKFIQDRTGKDVIIVIGPSFEYKNKNYLINSFRLDSDSDLIECIKAFTGPVVALYPHKYWADSVSDVSTKNIVRMTFIRG